MSQVSTVVGAIVLGIVAIFVFGLLFALPVMWLWNGCLVDAVTGLHPIGWMQAWGLNILFGILFNKSNNTKGN